MDEIGIAKRNNIMDIAKLESILRRDLNKNSQRRMAVLNPIKVIITNYDKNKTEYLQAINNPEDESAGKRELPFSRELFIEANDFMEDPPKKYFRLSPTKKHCETSGIDFIVSSITNGAIFFPAELT